MSATTQAPAGGAAAPEAPAAKGKKKLLIIVAGVVLLAAYFLVLAPSGGAEEPAPEPGEVLALDAVQVNLADGHYLRIGIALQFTTDAAHPDGSAALDRTIELFSGRSMEELAKPKMRKELKHELEVELERDYHGEVMGVYFTEFVTQ